MLISLAEFLIDGILKSFSLTSNGSRILDTEDRAGTLGALHGIRVLCILWIIWGHSNLYLGYGRIGNVTCTLTINNFHIHISFVHTHAPLYVQDMIDSFMYFFHLSLSPITSHPFHTFSYILFCFYFLWYFIFFSDNFLYLLDNISVQFWYRSTLKATYAVDTFFMLRYEYS